VKSGKGKTMEIIKTSVVTRDLGRGRESENGSVEE